MSDIYIRKNKISLKQLKEIVSQIQDEIDILENGLCDEFSIRYILVEYNEKKFYFDRETLSLFPVFKEHLFKKYYLNEELELENIISDFKDSFGGIEEWELLTKNDFRRCFYQEKKGNIIDDGILYTLDTEISSYLVIDNATLYCVNNQFDEIEEGYAIPIMKLKDFEGNKSEIKDIFHYWRKKEIIPVFAKKKQEERFLRLIELYGDLERYKKNKKINENEIILDIEQGKIEYIFSQDEYKNELLMIEKNRIDTDIYDEGILFDSKRGHWDIFYDQGKSQIDREVFKITVDDIIYARDPRQDIRYNGVVAIDFGTKSTVVACQRENDKSYLVKVGGGSYKSVDSFTKYENPTVMEFVDINKFRVDYNKNSGRPYTSWEDLLISHTAVSNYIAGSNAIVDGLKQWCGNKNEKIIIFDKQNEKVELFPYLECGENDFDPIEVYAYYIGSYINNMHTGDIFLEYILSFPITYEKEIREKMLCSFERGIKKSLPISVLDDEEIMKQFQVKIGLNEPTAYALCALKEFDLIPQNIDEYRYYGVFDFGGGTTDFSFGRCFRSTSRRYDYEVEHFGESGLKYLGGENILRVLSYEIFKENSEKMIEQDIPIFCPEGCEVNFSGWENVVLNSHISRFNMKQICEKIRPFWEEPKTFENEGERIKVSLCKKDGERIEGIELSFDLDHLQEIVKKMIENGIESFFNALSLVFKNDTYANDMENLTIFLAGNSSKNVLVQQLFREKLEFYTKEMNGENDVERFQLYLPLGYDKETQYSDSDDLFLNGKTGTAYGLLNSRTGSRVKITGIDEIKNNSEINFKYFVGYPQNGILTVILDYKNRYCKWVEFLDASEQHNFLYYSDKQIAIENILSTEDPSVRKLRFSIDVINESANIYIRIKDVETIEYVVAYKDEIEKGNYLSEIREIKLVSE